MAYNFREMYGRKLIASSLVFILVSASFFASAIPRAEAQIPVTDVAHIGVTAGEAFRKSALDALNAGAMFTAQILIEQIVASTVKWANSGFDGNPAYVTDPRQYFTDIADGVAGEYIEGTNLGFLCSPFQASIRLSLAQQYYEPEPFQCTLTDVVENIEDFYGDFSQGGWDAWFSMTQNPTNNPYGAYLEAKIELDSRVARAVGLEQAQLNWNQGFKSFADCLERDAAGECKDYGPVKTPGSIIKSGLDKVLPSGLDKLIKVEHINQLAQAFAVGLLQRFVFGPEGLFSKDSTYNYAETTYVDPNNSNQCIGPALPARSGSLPNELATVQAVAAEFPQYLQNSCLDQGGSWEFMDEVVRRLHEKDPNWGYNGKRGNTNDLSQDAISYYGGGGSASDGEKDVHVVDIIGGHCGANPQPAWQDVTNETLACGVTGAYVYPRGNRGAGIPSAPPPATPEELLQ